MIKKGSLIGAGAVALALAGGIYYLNHPSPIVSGQTVAASQSVKGAIPAGDHQVVLEKLGMF